MSFHYGKHHAAYVNNLNGLIDGTDLADASLDEIIVGADAGWPVQQRRPGLEPHLLLELHVTCLVAVATPPATSPRQSRRASDRSTNSRPSSRPTPSGTSDQAGPGSSRTTPVSSIVKTDDADTPLAHGGKALLTIDVWEHAYYLDFQNARPAYVDAYLEHLVNWEFAAANYSA